MSNKYPLKDGNTDYDLKGKFVVVDRRADFHIGRVIRLYENDGSEMPSFIPVDIDL